MGLEMGLGKRIRVWEERLVSKLKRDHDWDSVDLMSHIHLSIMQHYV